MSEIKETPDNILGIYHKKTQREQNYRRAEAFLLWKFGPMWDDARRFLRGSGMDWPSLFVEFCERVEEELLARTRHYEEAAYNNVMAQAMCNPRPQVISFADADALTVRLNGPRTPPSIGGTGIKDSVIYEKKETNAGE